MNADDQGDRRAAAAASEARRLLHELQVHQCELEMQNDELRQARLQIEEGLARFVDLYDNAPVSYFTIDRRGEIQQSNHAAAKLLHVDRSILIGRSFSDLLKEAERPPFARLVDRAFSSGEECEAIVMLCLDTGEYRTVQLQVRCDAKMEHCRIVATDISRMREAEEVMRIAASVYQAIGEAVLIADAGNRIISVNAAFTRLTGYEASEAIGQKTSLLKSGHHDNEFYRRMWHALEETGHWEGQIQNRRRNGEEYTERLSIHTIYDERGAVLRRIALFSDITEQRLAEEKIWRQANYDELTGLPNRRLFLDRLEDRLQVAGRSGQMVALLFIDLDRFKEVNDNLGHAVGDLLLSETGRRISSCVRAIDTVARIGGDEFTVIMADMSETDRVSEVVQNILESLRRPFYLDGQVVWTSGSLGVAMFPCDGDGQEDLLKHADQAMYVAKDRGRDQFSYFTPSMQRAAQERLELIADLRSAVSGNQLSIFAQPIVDLKSGAFSRAEALVRWIRPNGDLVLPEVFIPVAEETGLIHEVGDWIFREVLKQLTRLKMEHGRYLQISVNVSPMQITETTLNTWISYLNDSEIKAENIIIEVAESLLLGGRRDILGALHLFRSAGLMLAIDNFATGSSSISTLKNPDMEFLKIDRAFLSGLSRESDELVLIEAIVVMAHKLGMQVIAVGVETEEQYELLKAVGCDHAQGFFFARPAIASELF